VCHCEPAGRRKAPPDDRLREAIQRRPRISGLLRRFTPRNDGNAIEIVITGLDPVIHLSSFFENTKIDGCPDQVRA
jgi:hypothetical protein